MNVTKEINGSSAVICLEGWLDTPAAAELKEVLDGVSLELPEIRMFIEEYLREHIEALYTDEEE